MILQISIYFQLTSNQVPKDQQIRCLSVMRSIHGQFCDQLRDRNTGQTEAVG